MRIFFALRLKSSKVVNKIHLNLNSHCVVGIRKSCIFINSIIYLRREIIRGIKMSNSAEDTNLSIDILYDEIRLGCQLSSLWM